MKQRTFGGKCGVWLKRKKRRLMIDSSPCKNGTTLAQASSEICSSNKCDFSLKTEERSWETKCLSSSARLAGWDDIRCRPIYQTLPKLEHSVGFIEKEDIALRSADKFQTASYNSVCNLVERGKLSGFAEIKTERSYGERKCRSAGLLEAAIEVLHLNSSSPLRVSVSNTSKIAEEKKKITAKKKPAHMMKRRRKNRLSSETSTTLSTSPPSESDGVSVLSFTENLEEDDAAVNEKILVSNEVYSISNDEQQPSCNALPSQARAYFKRLDATEQLSVDVKDRPIETHSCCIRTTRRANIDCRKLKDDHAKYCRALSRSGVPPISLKEYANNRAHFQNAQNLDGFLDVALSPNATSKL